MTTVAEQSERFLAELANRKRRPVKPATLKSYGGFLRNWIVPNLGAMELSQVENGVMKKFVNLLVDQRLSPATVNGAVTTPSRASCSSESPYTIGKNNPRRAWRVSARLICVHRW
jgi:hypothetical protein